MTLNVKWAPIPAILGGAIAGSIGASVAQHSDGAPILKGALATGAIEAALVSVIAAIEVGGDDFFSKEDVAKLIAASAMGGTAIGAVGAAVSETAHDHPILLGTFAGSVVALLFNSMLATVASTGSRQLSTRDNPSLSGWELFP